MATEGCPLVRWNAGDPYAAAAEVLAAFNSHKPGGEAEDLAFQAEAWAEYVPGGTEAALDPLALFQAGDGACPLGAEEQPQASAPSGLDSPLSLHSSQHAFLALPDASPASVTGHFKPPADLAFLEHQHSACGSQLTAAACLAALPATEELQPSAFAATARAWPFKSSDHPSSSAATLSPGGSSAAGFLPPLLCPQPLPQALACDDAFAAASPHSRKAASRSLSESLFDVIDNSPDPLLPGEPEAAAGHMPLGLGALHIPLEPQPQQPDGLAGAAAAGPGGRRRWPVPTRKRRSAPAAAAAEQPQQPPARAQKQPRRGQPGPAKPRKVARLALPPARPTPEPEPEPEWQPPGARRRAVSARGRRVGRLQLTREQHSEEGERGGASNRRSKHHNPWSLEETEALVEGVERCGGGKWADIKKLGLAAIERRSPVDLKDKWRNLLAALQRASSDKRRGDLPDELLERVRSLVPLTATRARGEARPSIAWRAPPPAVRTRRRS